jgi:molybdopterin adenylyltransferase
LSPTEPARPAPLRSRVLTVSDGVVGGTREDRSGAALAELLANEGYEVVDRTVCSDGIDEVSEALGTLAEGFTGLIVTTGGTGFGPRDLTPEGTRRVIERAAPGLAEAMRAVSPLGRLSRGVAGTAGRCLILNLPGSPGGAVESIRAVLDILPHALGLLAGEPDPHPVGTRHQPR